MDFPAVNADFFHSDDIKPETLENGMRNYERKTLVLRAPRLFVLGNFKPQQ